jgi:hypothetical protein
MEGLVVTVPFCEPWHFHLQDMSADAEYVAIRDCPGILHFIGVALALAVFVMKLQPLMYSSEICIFERNCFSFF